MANSTLVSSPVGCVAAAGSGGHASEALLTSPSRSVARRCQRDVVDIEAGNAPTACTTCVCGYKRLPLGVELAHGQNSTHGEQPSSSRRCGG